MAKFVKKYNHGLIILVFNLVYMAFFSYLEHRVVFGYHIIHSPIDDYIPFCEFFIVPYMLWFPYMYCAVIYFIFFNKDKKEYYRLICNLMMGMTVFIIVSYYYPNMQALRPTSFTRDNIFIHWVKWLYLTDTPTNVLPSIHVFNSIAIHTAIVNCKALSKKPIIQYGSLALTCLIVLSTMFLKQHSFVDVCLGITMATFGYFLFYTNKIFAHYPIFKKYYGEITSPLK